MEIINVTEELLSKLGKELDRTGYQDRGNRAEAILMYVDGIPCFDKILDPNKFVETNCLFEVIACENCMIFALVLPNATTISNFLIWRKDIISPEFMENHSMEVSKFNSLKALLPLGPGSGLLGLTVAELTFNKFKNNKGFKVVGSRIKSGTSIKLKYNDEEENNIKEINIDLPKDMIFSPGFYSRYWKKDLSGNEKQVSKCYIATACFGKDSNEVIILRNYRDEVLSKFIIGRLFIKFYYFTSPSMVRYLYNNEIVKIYSRKFIGYLINRIKVN